MSPIRTLEPLKKGFSLLDALHKEFPSHTFSIVSERKGLSVIYMDGARLDLDYEKKRLLFTEAEEVDFVLREVDKHLNP